MNIIRQIENFIKTANQNNDIVELNGREMSDITYISVRRKTETCQCINFTIMFSNEELWTFLLDIDTTTLMITDKCIQMETVPIHNLTNYIRYTICVNDDHEHFMADKKSCSRHAFTFSIKKKVPTITIDVNDL